MAVVRLQHVVPVASGGTFPDEVPFVVEEREPPAQAHQPDPGAQARGSEDGGSEPVGDPPRMLACWFPRLVMLFGWFPCLVRHAGLFYVSRRRIRFTCPSRTGRAAVLDDALGGARPGSPIVVDGNVEARFAGSGSRTSTGSSPRSTSAVGQKSTTEHDGRRVTDDPLHAEDDLGLEALHVDLDDVEGPPWRRVRRLAEPVRRGRSARRACAPPHGSRPGSWAVTTWGAGTAGLREPCCTSGLGRRCPRGCSATGRVGPGGVRRRRSGCPAPVGGRTRLK